MEQTKGEFNPIFSVETPLKSVFMGGPQVTNALVLAPNFNRLVWSATMERAVKGIIAPTENLRAACRALMEVDAPMAQPAAANTDKPYTL